MRPFLLGADELRRLCTTEVWAGLSAVTPAVTPKGRMHRALLKMALA